MEEWLKNLPGELANEVIWQILSSLVALFAYHNWERLRRIFRRPTVIKLKPASLAATPQKLTVVQGKSLLSAAGELLWWWAQVR
jgi:hypothetical protein